MCVCACLTARMKVYQDKDIRHYEHHSFLRLQITRSDTFSLVIADVLPVCGCVKLYGLTSTLTNWVHMQMMLAFQDGWMDERCFRPLFLHYQG